MASPETGTSANQPLVSPVATADLSQNLSDAPSSSLRSIAEKPAPELVRLDVSNWTIGQGYAQIVTFEQFNAFDRDSLGRIVCTSGGYDPSHPGHLSCLIESKKHGDTLVAIVNGDNFLITKKGMAFQDLKTRCQIISCIREVDYVIPFEINNDQTVCEALRLLKPHAFTKGGDRTDYTNIPEWSVCQEFGIEIIPQIGLNKDWSSSDFLRNWGEFWARSKTVQ